MEGFKLLRHVVYLAFGLLFLCLVVFIGINVEQFKLSAVYTGLETWSFITSVASITTMYVATAVLLLAVASVISALVRRLRLIG